MKSLKGISVGILDKYKYMAQSAKAALWFTVCNFFLKGISFIANPIFTRLLSADEYGQLSIFMSYEQLMLILATWSIQIGAYQKGIFKYKDDVELFTTATLCLINTITLICFLFIFIFQRVIFEISGMTFTILCVLFVYFWVQPAYECWLIRQRTKYKYHFAVAITIFYTIANTLIPMGALIVVAPTADVKFIFTIVSAILISLTFYCVSAKYWRLFQYLNKVKEYWKFLIYYQGPLVLHSLSYLVLGQVDRVMISVMVGKEQTAYYSVAYNLATVISILQNSLNQSLLPWYYQMLSEKQYRKICRITNYLLCAIGGAILGYILLAPEVLHLLFTKSYYEAVWCIPPVSASVYFQFLYTIFVNIETYFEKTKYVMYVSVICGVINVILNYICIDRFGYIASGYTTLFSYILFAVGHYIFMERTRKIEVPQVRILKASVILIISLIVIFLSIGITMLYPFPLIRYGIILLLVICVFISRKRFISILDF